MAINRIFTIPLRSRSAALLNNTFQPINPGGFILPVFFLRINNATDRAVFLSFDGVTEHEFLAIGQVFEVNGQTNAQPNNYMALFAQRQVVWVLSPTGAGTGAVYISGYSQEVR
jgi:hypothetical protein